VQLDGVESKPRDLRDDRGYRVALMGVRIGVEAGDWLDLGFE
jgi:hypothetical protein